MSATKNDIRSWFQVGKANGATHMIVVTDTFNFENHPVYVNEGESVEEKEKECERESMQRVEEVYSLSLDMESQLSEDRAFHRV